MILHVERPPPLATLGGTAGVPPPPNEYDRERLWQELQAIQTARDSITVEHRLEYGDPAAVILKVAEEIATDLIVMGTHGRTGLRRLLMGSMAEQVVRKAPCPVLTVRTAMHTLLSLPSAAAPRSEVHVLPVRCPSVRSGRSSARKAGTE